MKNIISIGLFAILVLAGCENRPIEFDDYTYQTVYFPLQGPVRTLELGESRFDNSIDLEHAFSIGVQLGGVYSNDIERVVNFEVAPELAENVYFVEGPDTMMMDLLPESYYSLSSTNQFIILAGEMIGKIRVDLEDAFFEDPLSAGKNYLLPLKLVSAEDSILSGRPAVGVEDPDIRVAEDWEIVPKNYTLFGIKYINKYHGIYLHRGIAYKKPGLEGPVEDTIIYSEQFIPEDQLTMLSTVSLNSGILDRMARGSGGSNIMTLTFSDAGDIAIDSITGANQVFGSGQFFTSDDPNAESWGGSKHQTMYLNYTYFNGTNYLECFDTLVFRDNNMTFEEFAPVIIED